MKHESQDGTSPVETILMRVAADAGVSPEEVRRSIAALIAESGVDDDRKVTPESLILTLAAQVIDRMQDAAKEQSTADAVYLTRDRTENG